MNHAKTFLLAAAVGVTLGSNSAAFANEEDDAVRLCERQISDTYDVNKFHNVWAEPQGHHKFKVHGNVKYQHDKHPFDCVVKRGYVQSFHYNGPHPGLAGDNDGMSDNAKKALAVGAGLAIVAALANTAKDKGYSQTHMQDDCADALTHRMRNDHHDSARFSITRSELKGDILSGEGNVRWGHDRPNHVEFSCLFQNHRVDDTNYVLY